MEDLTPELERRIQVEELWGRRIVLEETMNAWRFREYQSRRLLSLLGSEEGGPKPALRSAATTGIDQVRPSRSPAFRLRHAAVIAVVAASAWFAGQQAYAKFLLPMVSSEVHQISPSAHEARSATEAARSKSDEVSWRRPGGKLRPLDADLKRIFGSAL